MQQGDRLLGRSIARRFATATAVGGRLGGRPDLVRAAVVGGAAAYAATLGFAPWLPPAVLPIVAAAQIAALGSAWLRRGRPDSLLFVAGLWGPGHLLILATGGIASPLLPAAIAWVVFAATRSRLTIAAGLAAGATALLLAADAWMGTLTPALAVEAVVVGAIGFAPARLLERLRVRTLDQVNTLERILAEADEDADGTVEVEAAKRLEALGEALDRVRRNLGARRATVWDVEDGGETARPWLASGGAAPKAVSLAGDPLHWAWKEGVPLQLESSPRWASGAALAYAVPLQAGAQHAALLTLEYEPEREPPNPGELDDAASYLRAFIRTQREEARAVASREYFSQVLDLLRRLPREMEPGVFAEELADTARVVADGTGALVATWEDGGGRILAGVGDD
ncbi:MAG: GAF domain-containing protein, partial [Gemmatimonadota bacterium]